MGLFSWFTQDIAIDLGTANTLIIHNDEIVVNEPSIVALDRNNPKQLLAVGKKALLMHFGTARAVRSASLEDLQKAPGVSAAVAQTVHDFYHSNG